MGWLVGCWLLLLCDVLCGGSFCFCVLGVVGSFFLLVCFVVLLGCLFGVLGGFGGWFCVYLGLV